MQTRERSHKTHTLPKQSDGFPICSQSLFDLLVVCRDCHPSKPLLPLQLLDENRILFSFTLIVRSTELVCVVDGCESN